MDGSTMAGYAPACSEIVAPVSVPPAKPAEDRAALVRSIAALAADGYAAEEISKALNIPRARVIRIAKRKGIDLARAGGRRGILVDLPLKHVERVAVLAEVAKVTRAVMVARMVAALLEEDDARVRWRLGSHARPKRVYKARSKQPA